MNVKSTFGFLFVFLICLAAEAKQKKQPNIILILVDDMGYSDLSCFGGEIPTPNIDMLAKNGICLNNFYNSARCCPTRASLLTGVYPHQAGIGYMTAAIEDNPAYQGFLNNSTVTIAEAMKQAGYFTIMTGKWHVGKGVDPWLRGFDRSLSAPSGGFYFKDRKAKVFLNGKDVTNVSNVLPENWYSTDLWTSYGLKFAKEATTRKQPFIWYLAHNAPHFPLQAPKEEIAKFSGKYLKGWEVLRKERYQRQIKLGLIDKSIKLPSFNPIVPKWNTLSQEEKKKQDNLMAVYAAVISRIDKSIGDLIVGLKEAGEYENTVIMLMSDNGGNAEGGIEGRYIGQNPGAVGTSLWLSQGWAELNNTPFWLYKHHTSEGGIASPFIFSWPEGMVDSLQGEILSTPAHVIDLMPTCLDIANGVYPKLYKGKGIIPAEGVSLLPLLNGKNVSRKQPLFWEHEGNRAMRDGNWKIVSNLTEDWQLYNIANDRTELHDLAKTDPALLDKMVRSYETWYTKVGAYPYFKEPKKWQIRMGVKAIAPNY